jgi:hypothetical protein
MGRLILYAMAAGLGVCLLIVRPERGRARVVNPRRNARRALTFLVFRPVACDRAAGGRLEGRPLHWHALHGEPYAVEKTHAAR